MRIIHFRIAAAAACLLVAGAGASIGAPPAQTIPYVETFESYANNAALTNDATSRGWSLGAPGGTVGITNDSMEGASAAFTDMGNLTLSIDDETKSYGNVWCRIVTKPTFYDDDEGEPKVDEHTFAAFYINKTKQIKAYDGNQWKAVGSVTGEESDWRTLIVHAQYSGSTWDIYESSPDVNGTSWDVYQSKACRRVNSLPIAANTAYNPEVRRMTGLEITGKAKIDAIAIAQDHQTPAQSRDNVVVHTTTIPTNAPVLVALPIEAYGEDTEDALLDSDTSTDLLGKDILSWLNGSDAVKVGANTYYVDAGGGAWSSDPEDVRIKMGASVSIFRDTANSPSGPLVCFSDYNTLSLRTEVDQDILGGATATTPSRWNKLGWTRSTAGTLSTELPASLAASGDQIFKRVNGRNRRLFIKDLGAGPEWTLDGVHPFTGQFEPFEAFRYYRNSTDNRVWK